MIDPGKKERDKIIRRAVRESSKPFKPTQTVEPAPPPKRKHIWAVDFDGTLCENWWPNIGPPNYELINLLKCARKAGIALILWTCREGELLDNALQWCREFGLEFDAANDNLPDVCAAYGQNPRKISATLYLDDRAVHIDRRDWCKELWTTVNETLSEIT